MANPEPSNKSVKMQSISSLLMNIAVVSAIFAVILCVLIIINFIQIKRTDPLNSLVMKMMIERMHTDPGDEQLRQEIREIDLLARKAFFTNQWQVRMGGYLLFFSLLVAISCIQGIALLHKALPRLPSGVKSDFWIYRKINRTWVIYSGISVIICSFLLIILTHRELGEKLGKVMLDDRNAGMQSMQTMQKMQAMEKMQAIQGNGKVDTGGKVDSMKSTLTVNMDGFPSMLELVKNFPSFRGPGGIGIASQKNIPISWDGKTGKNILWKISIPLPGYNSPIIWNDRIFLAGANETKRAVYCVDIKTGKILWQKMLEKIPGSPSGEPKIIRETGYSAPGMTTDGRRVYAIFANGDLIAVDLEGKQVWVKNLGVPQNHYGHSSSLIMYRDLLIVQYDQHGSGSVMALSGKTGQAVWKTSRNVKVSWASPVIVQAGRRAELILAADPMVASYDPADGKELWRMECISGEVGPSIAYSNGVVYAVNDYSKLSALEIGDTPKLLWEDTEYLSDIPSPLATGKYLFLVTSYGAVVCYDAKNGTKYWEQELGTPVFASPILAEGKIYLLDKKGNMHIFNDDQTYKVISQSPLGESSSCTPAFADGKIVIRGDHNLYCIGK